jgi:hypothetical protein
VTAAAREIAIAEDRAVFHGYEAAQITGICQQRAGVGVPLGASHADYPLAVATALTKMRDEGVEGPFSVVLNDRLYRDLSARTDSGYPIISHVKRLIDGDIVWAPGIDGGLVLSQRGGDFELSVGQDFSIGYLEHNTEKVRLYIEESFTFLILTDEAAIPLTTRRQEALASLAAQYGPARMAGPPKSVLAFQQAVAVLPAGTPAGCAGALPQDAQERCRITRRPAHAGLIELRTKNLDAGGQGLPSTPEAATRQSGRAEQTGRWPCTTSGVARKRSPISIGRSPLRPDYREALENRAGLLYAVRRFARRRSLHAQLHAVVPSP